MNKETRLVNTLFPTTKMKMYCAAQDDVTLTHRVNRCKPCIFFPNYTSHSMTNHVTR